MAGKRIERRSKIPRRQVDKDRRNILRNIKHDFDAVVRPLQDEVERQKEVRRRIALALHEWRNAIITQKFPIDRKDCNWKRFMELAWELEGIDPSAERKKQK